MKNIAGFTLVEMMLVLAIASILLLIGLPSFSSLVQRTERSSTVNGMIGLFSYARSAAITHGTLVTICPTANSVDCTNDWNQDIMVFTDPDNDRSVSDDEVVLRIQQPNNTALWSMRPANKSYFQFDPDGSVHGTLGSLLYCHQSLAPEQARRLYFNLGGRTRLSRDRNGDGVHEDNDGKALSCAPST